MGQLNSSLRTALAVAGLGALCGSSLAGSVTTSTALQSFYVEGATAVELVRYMNRNAFEGDSGRAYANMHPDYELSMTTKQVGGLCRPASIDLHVALRLTLPVADTSTMRQGTRALWTNFLVFARAHENHHRVTYLGCARAFAQKLQRQSAPSCTTLQWAAEQMLEEMASACEASEQPYERSQARLLPNLPLFRAAAAGR